MMGSELALIGIPVRESRYLPPGKMVMLNENGQKVLYVQDMWRDLQWPLFLSKQRKLAREHLKGIVDGACYRLFEGCCTDCDGEGRDMSSPETNGKCWSCYGTGHTHA